MPGYDDQDELDDDRDDEVQVPILGSIVYIQADCLSDLQPCLCHWASTTPEMKVLPERIVTRCRAWLERDGLVPGEDLSLLARDSPLLHHLMMVEAKRGYVQSGDFWQLSDAFARAVGKNGAHRGTNAYVHRAGGTTSG